jgi:hypothetical protein
MNDVLYAVIATSEEGDRLVGVYSDLDKAWANAPPEPVGGLSFRVEYVVLDAPVRTYAPWWLTLSREGEVLDVSDTPDCACEDECYVVPGGDYMRIIVWAHTRQRAIDVAGAYRRDLVETGAWDPAGMDLPVLHTERPPEA